MPRAIAFLADTIHATAHEGFAARGIEVRTFRTAVQTGELLAQLQAVDGPARVLVGVRSKTRIEGRLFEEPRVCAVGAYCIGTDQIDLEEARRRGVVVFNAPFSNTRSVAELVLCEIVMLARQEIGRAHV